MKRRAPPRPLYDTVLALASALVQPAAASEAAVDAAAARKARAELMALFHRYQEAGTPDPFQTETVADFTSNPDEAVRLYKLAIEQSATFPGEPLHTKRCGLIETLIEMSHDAEAREVLAQARLAAFAARDSEAIQELDALAKQIAV